MAGKMVTRAESPDANSELVAKLVEVFNARLQLNGSIDSMREWFNNRKPGEDFGIRLLGCLLWASELQTQLIQAQIIAKGEEQ